jgi:2-haloacid dehalogenase
MNDIKTIVFDVGEVLIDWDPRNLYRKVFDDEQEMEFFLSDVCDYEWNYRQDAGYCWDKAIAEKIAQHPKYEEQIKLYKTRWPEMVKGGVEGSVEVLKKLKEAGWPVFAITNYHHETFALSKELWPFLNLFDGEVVSGEEKLCKPDARIYEICIERFNLVPQQCVFIDDRQENIDGAIKAGMNGILFESSGQMKTDLEKMIGTI